MSVLSKSARNALMILGFVHERRVTKRSTMCSIHILMAVIPSSETGGEAIKVWCESISWAITKMIQPALPTFMDAIGAVAAVLTTLCSVPQVVKIIRDRETRAISLPATTLSALGILLWLVYGWALADAPLIGSSAATLAITTTILALKIRHG